MSARTDALVSRSETGKMTASIVPVVAGCHPARAFINVFVLIWFHPSSRSLTSIREGNAFGASPLGQLVCQAKSVGVPLLWPLCTVWYSRACQQIRSRWTTSSRVSQRSRAFPFGWQNHTYDATVEDFAAWGWRIAFLLSAVLVVLPADKLRLFFVVVLIALAAQMALYAFGIRFI